MEREADFDLLGYCEGIDGETSDFTGTYCEDNSLGECTLNDDGDACTVNMNDCEDIPVDYCANFYGCMVEDDECTDNDYSGELDWDNMEPACTFTYWYGNWCETGEDIEVPLITSFSTHSCMKYSQDSCLLITGCEWLGDYGLCYRVDDYNIHFLVDTADCAHFDADECFYA